jgi:hypothetical protein
VYTSSVSVLRSVAEGICREYRTMCFSVHDPDDLVLFIFTWVEGFYYVDPVECSGDLKCIEEILGMHGDVFKLARMGLYEIQVDEGLLRKAVERLLALSDKRKREKLA